jgi:hypothetical protein
MHAYILLDCSSVAESIISALAKNLQGTLDVLDSWIIMKLVILPKQS